MREFFASLLYASVIGGLGASLVGKAYQKHLRCLTALLCAALLVSPLLKLLLGFDFTFPEEAAVSAADGDAAESLIIAQSAADAESALSRCIFSETGIKPVSVSIDIESREQELSFAKVSVKTAGQSEAKAVREFLEALFKGGLPIEVTSENQ